MSPRFSMFWLAVIPAALWPTAHLPADDGATNAAPAPHTSSSVASLIDEAAQNEENHDYEQAIGQVSAALDLDPKNFRALELRATIYMEEKIWDLAERDYTTLNEINPDPSYRYKLAQIKFAQKQYDDARPLFAALKGSERLGDLAAYHVYLCDLFGGHEKFAFADLATFDRKEGKPSYFFANAIWDGYHGQAKEGNLLLVEAQHRFSAVLFGLYYDSLAEVRPFHADTATFTTKDGRNFQNVAISLEGDGLRVSTAKGWITVPLDQLPDDLSPFPDEVRERIALQRDTAPSPAPARAAETQLSFTTKAGKTYHNVRWTLEDGGLEVLTQDGWKLVPFDDLPADLSSFPPGLQKEIADQKSSDTAKGVSYRVVSFTTRSGKSYDAVRAQLEDDGLHVLTSDGWTRIAFTDLPSDLAPFPAEWRTQIQAELKAAAGDDSLIRVVSFTTTRGMAYNNLRATLEASGVAVLTPDGWVTVPFTDLPADLSGFPPEWRTQIQAGLKASNDDGSEVKVVSFTTKRGKSYEEVRTALDDDGLRVLGPDGFVLVPYSDVPDDLAPFPASWRTKIATRQKEANAAGHTQ